MGAASSMIACPLAFQGESIVDTVTHEPSLPFTPAPTVVIGDISIWYSVEAVIKTSADLDVPKPIFLAFVPAAISEVAW